MAAKLVAKEGLLKGLVLTLENGEEWVTGRDPDACQLTIEDSSVSRRHLIFKKTNEEIYLENLSATNPTKINGEIPEVPKLLQTGDLIQIGDTSFKFFTKEEEELPLEEEQEEVTQKETQEEEELTFQEQEDEESDIPKETPISQEETEKEEGTTKHALLALPQEEELPSEEEPNDSIFDEHPTHSPPLTEVNFDLLETGRWLLKVIAGPNNGAEFSMQPQESYLIGTDPNTCDIIFHDTSVSRQHIRLSLSEDDRISIEDLNSRNGTFIEHEKLEGKRLLPPNTVVSLGTTSFIVYDREGEMQTIISPLLPSIVKVLQREEEKKEEAEKKEEERKEEEKEEKQDPLPEIEDIKIPPTSTEEKKPDIIDAQFNQEKIQNTLGAFILIAIITGLFVIIGIGVATLFKGEPVQVQQPIDIDQILPKVLTPFPLVKYSFNKSTGNLLLVGHVSTSSDKNQLIYDLQGLNFIKNIDDSGVIIDEYVWQEINQVLIKNPNWKTVTLQSPAPGKFIVSGYLQTRKQAELLNEYLTSNFPYLELLDKKIIVEEDLITGISNALQNKGIKDISVQISNGELLLKGSIPKSKKEELLTLIQEFQKIPGIRVVNNFITDQAPEQSVLNLTGKYEVTGYSNLGQGKVTVVINGRILSKGDLLDGMVIKEIKSNAVFLEKDDVKFRIDYSR